MPASWRLMVFIYNLLLIFVSGSLVALAMGYRQPLLWLETLLATPQNRLLTGIVAGLLVIIGLYLLIAGLKRDKPRTMTVQEGPLGDVSMTIPAVKQIIMKAARNVEGLREVRPEVEYTSSGVSIRLHLMINPDYKVPEMTEALQNQVSRYLEEIGGLQVAEIKVLVDDIAAQGPRVK